MQRTTARIAATAAITGALVFGGYGLASAQEEDPTTTTVQEDSSATTEESTDELDRSLRQWDSGRPVRRGLPSRPAVRQRLGHERGLDRGRPTGS